MATPSIKIDQVTKSAGTTAVSRTDLALGQVVTVTDTANPGAGTHLWVLRARPVGSAVVLATASTATATFTPDVAGTYLLEKSFNGSSSGTLNTLDDFVSTQGGAAVLLASGFRIPAAGETLQFSNSQGWHTAMDNIIRTVDARLPSANQKTDLTQLDGASAGSVWYANGSNRVTRLAPGTSGQVLTSNGVSAPTWGASGSAPSGAAGGGLAGTYPNPTVANATITDAKLATMPATTIKGNNTAGTAAPVNLTAAEVAALLPVATTGAKGLAPASGGGTVNFLRADLTFADPVAAATVTNTKLATMTTATVKGRTTAGTGAPEDLTGPQVTAMLSTATTGAKGLAPASGGGTTNFLRADLTWAAPPSATIPDGDKGDIVTSLSGASMVIDTAVVTNAKLANMAAATFKGRKTGSTGVPVDMTKTEATAELNTFTTLLKGLAPAPATTDGTRFLRDDGSWSVPGATGLPELQQQYAAPSYIYPTDPQWNDMEALATAGKQTYCEFNPSNGPGYNSTHASGSTFTDYNARLLTANAAGLTVLHYLATNYFDEETAHPQDRYAGTVGGSYRITCATNDEITFVGDGTLTPTGTAGSPVTTMIFPSGFGPVGVKLWNNASATGVGSTMAAGLAASTSYWLRPVSATPTSIYTLHTSKAGALANTGKVDITATGTGPIWLGIRKTPALAVGADGTVLAEMDLVVARYPTIGGWFFDEAQVDGAGYDSTFDAIIAHRNANYPGLIICVNGTPYNSTRANMYDVYSIENTWPNILSGAEPIPAYQLDGSVPSSKAWMLVSDACTASDVVPAIAFSRANKFGHVFLCNGSFSRLPKLANDGYDNATVIAEIDAGNLAPVESDPPLYGSLVLSTSTAHTPVAAVTAKLNAASTAGETLAGLTATTPQRLTHTGSTTRKVCVDFDVTFKKASGTATDLTFRIYRSGGSMSGQKTIMTVAATDTGYQTVKQSYIITLAPSQYVEIYVNSTNTDVLTVHAGNLTVSAV